MTTITTTTTAPPPIATKSIGSIGNGSVPVVVVVVVVGGSSGSVVIVTGHPSIVNSPPNTSCATPYQFMVVPFRKGPIVASIVTVLKTIDVFCHPSPTL